MNRSFEDCCITANKNRYSLVFDVFGVKKDGSVCQNRVPNLSKKLIFKRKREAAEPYSIEDKNLYDKS